MESGKYLDVQSFLLILTQFEANFEKQLYPAKNGIFKYIYAGLTKTF